jgi:hypothetical protein
MLLPLFMNFPSHEYYTSKWIGKKIIENEFQWPQQFKPKGIPTLTNLHK